MGRARVRRHRIYRTWPGNNVCRCLLLSLLEGIGGGTPVANEKELDDEHAAYDEDIENLRCQLEDGGGSIGDIVDSTDMSSCMLPEVVLRPGAKSAVRHGARRVAIVAELIINALGSVSALNGDANRSLGAIMDGLGDACDTVAEKPAPDPCVDYGSRRLREVRHSLRFTTITRPPHRLPQTGSSCANTDHTGGAGHTSSTHGSKHDPCVDKVPCY